MLKRSFDIIFSLLGLVIASPLLLVAMLFVWLYDRHSPLYIANRVGLSFSMFKMYKVRTMVSGSDKSGVDSTSAVDPRITPIGKWIRGLKVDELAQLINVLKGDMTLVGPRPNVKNEVDLYTSEEKRILTIKPGITDISSIVFSDLADILIGENDANIAYNQLVRPWKSRLALFYIDKRGFFLDMAIIVITFLSVFSRSLALLLVRLVMIILNADSVLINIAARRAELVPSPPPGTTEIVTTRECI